MQHAAAGTLRTHTSSEAQPSLTRTRSHHQSFKGGRRSERERGRVREGERGGGKRERVMEGRGTGRVAEGG